MKRLHRRSLPEPAVRRWGAALAALLLLFALFVALLRVPPPWTLDMGAPGDTFFSTGFSVAEQGDGATFRWSGPESELLLHGAGVRPFVLALRLHRNQSMADQRYGLALERDTQTFATFALPPEAGWRVYRVLLPPEAVAAAHGDTLPLALTSTTYRPGDGDSRALGVPLDYVRVKPLPGLPAAWGLLLWRAALLTWLVGIVGYGLSAVGYRLSVIGYGLAGSALLAWAALNPYTLAWALPPLPWMLVLATLVLVIGQRRWAMGDGRWAIGEMALGARRSALGLALVVVLALALRLYQIDALPYGLWRDEARHGLFALRILDTPGYRPVYIAEGGVNMPAFGFYPFALALDVWGIHIWTMRTVTALAGALTVLPLYALVRRLFGRADVALLAAAFLAMSSWHITLSRFSFPTVFEPLLSLSGLWLLAVALAPPEQAPRRTLLRLGAALLGGVCLGLAMQMYHTGRVVPVVAGLLALLLLWQARAHWRHWLAGAATAALGFALVTAPLVAYALTNTDAMDERVGRVFLLTNAIEQGRAPLAALDDSVGRHLLMFNVRGDSNSRHHAPERPLLDYVTGAGFVVGALLLLRGWRDWRSLFVLGALVLGLLPSLLAANGPHAMRSIGALPYAYIVAALGWAALLGWLAAGAARYSSRAAQAARWLAPALVLLLALLLNYWTYFVYMPTETRVWTSFYPIHTQVGAYLREQAEEQGAAALRDVYVHNELAQNSVFRYLTYGLPVQTYSYDPPDLPDQPGALVVFSGYSHAREAERFGSTLDMTRVAAGPPLPGTDAPSFVVYRANHAEEEQHGIHP
jgi:4-amino-4-deoxy-L-arabinose transferase-like glycosyltransferase